MKIIGNNRGLSSILIVLFLGAALLVLFTSVGHDMNSLNKATVDLREYTNTQGAIYDIAQLVGQAYQKSKALGPGVACDAHSMRKDVAGLGMGICIPKNIYQDKKFCSQNNASYCIKTPIELSLYQGDADKNVFVVQNSSGTEKRPAKPVLFQYFMNTAVAAPPAPWLPDLTGALPTLSIVSPTCTGIAGNDLECIRCGIPNKNADCIKIKICTNGETNCPDPNQYIEPIFAFQFDYPN